MEATPSIVMPIITARPLSRYRVTVRIEFPPHLQLQRAERQALPSHLPPFCLAPGGFARRYLGLTSSAQRMDVAA